MKLTKQTLRNSVFFGFALAAINPANLYAQDSDNAVELSPITVNDNLEKGDGPVEGYVAKQTFSGMKTDTPLVKVPQTINVVTADQMADQGAQSVAESLNYTPNVLTNYRGRSNLHDEVFMRGFEYASKFLDGMDFGQASYGQLDPYLMERVEVIKGPSSILYGQIMPGGLINSVLKRPTGEQKSSAEIAFGTDQYLRLGADVETKLNDQVDLRLVASGWKKELQDDVDQNRGVFAPSLKWSNNEGTELNVDAIYQTEPDAGARYFKTRVGTLTPTSGGYFIDRDLVSVAPDFDRTERKTMSLGYELDHRFNDVFKIVHKARYNDIDLDHEVVAIDSVTNNTLNLGVIRTYDKFNQFTTDNQMVVDLKTGEADHEVLFGLDFKKSSKDTNYAANWGSGLTYDLANPRFITRAQANAIVPTRRFHEDTRLTQTGLYLQDQINYQDLTVVLGLRKDWAKTDVVDVTGASATKKYNDQAMSYRIGASYEAAYGITPYASFSTSFEPVIRTAAQGYTLKPSEGRQFEIGAKWASEDERIMVTGSVFDIEQTNIAEYSASAGGFIPVGTIESKGFELEGRARVTDQLSLIASYGRVDAEITKGANAGFKTKRTPKQTAAAWVKYEAENGLGSALGVRYVGESYATDDNSVIVPSVTTLDARFSMDMGKLVPQMSGTSASLNITNLTDKEYVSSCTGNYCWQGEGLKAVVGLKYEW